MKIFDMPQGTVEWFSVRSGTISASNFKKILTPKANKLAAGRITYAYQLVAQMAMGYRPPTDVEAYTSREMEYGIDTEPEARSFYSMETGRTVREVGFITDDEHRIGCSPDGLVDDGNGGLELKCPTARHHVAYMLDPGSLVEEYKHQVHGCMIVSERPWWDIMSYCIGLPPVLVRVERNEYTDSLEEALVVFADEVAQMKAKVEQMCGREFIRPKIAPPKPAGEDPVFM